MNNDEDEWHGLAGITCISGTRGKMLKWCPPRVYRKQSRARAPLEPLEGSKPGAMPLMGVQGRSPSKVLPKNWVFSKVISVPTKVAPGVRAPSCP